MKNKPLVSICSITYNHERYISQAIEGFLMQKTSFPIEIIIHDDASTDGTADIIRYYEKQNPDIIKPIYQIENQLSQGIRLLHTYVLPKVRGKYIALCEGDDYWTDSYKLQKQVDFLEANEDYSGAAHCNYIYLNNKKLKYSIQPYSKNKLTLNDFLYKIPIHTATFVFRKEIIEKHSVPDYMFSGDRVLYFLVSSFGNIVYFKESMSIHRIHDGGVSQSLSQSIIDKDFAIIPWICSINKDFPKNAYKAFIYRTKYLSRTNAPLKDRIKWFVLFLKNMFSVKPINYKEILYTIIFLHNKRLLISIMDFIFKGNIERRQKLIMSIRRVFPR